MTHRAAHRFVLAALAASTIGAAAGGAEVSLEDEARLERGQVVAHIVEERGPGGRLMAAIDIPAPPREVWTVMLDCARAPAYVPGLESCRILETAADGRSDLREHRIRWIALLPRLTLRFRSEYIPEREIRVARISGDLAQMDGAWRLEPRDNGQATRLYYDFRIVPNRLLPSPLVRARLLRDTPRVLEAVRAEVARTAAH